MLNWIVNKIVGSQNERIVKSVSPIVEKINSFESAIQGLTDEQLLEKTNDFRQKLRQRIRELGGEAERDLPEETDLKEGRKKRRKVERQALDGILPEAFAVVREAGRRFLSMRHFDVQLIGGVVLHRGMIAEMATGEGKTLVATLPVYLNALLGRGVHVVTVNDYLAKRDRSWMGPLYEKLGLTIGVIQHDMDPAARRAAYACDVTYGTNNEFGFDHLRDNMTVSVEECVQREMSYAIVDEVDSILIDEARTPLIISGPAEESTQLYYQIDRIVPQLTQGTDFQVDEKAHSAVLSEEGIKKAESLLGVGNLYEDTNVTLVHHINQALRAHHLYKKDVDYMIKDGQVVIVDEFTGRLMPGRRWSDGLHQAVEAKEGVKIERENQTLATITFQNYFRMYGKLAGMTGTASTEAAEFHQIYNLEVVTIPTNRPLIRSNFPDVVFKSEREKFEEVVKEIAQLHQKGQPVLVGTVSIQKSERLSQLLKQRQVPHHVLNARYHEQEAQIVAQAGRFGAVTIATNMAGRGTDIVLGGNPTFLIAAELKRFEPKSPTDPAISPQQEKEISQRIQTQVEQEHHQVVSLGGLHVLGTERHEARRIDNQLRGRSGRQGDPGSSRFYLSLEDDLIRIFGENRLLEWTKSAIPDGEAIEHPWLTRAVETAQKRVEMHNFDIRKRLLEYDNVMNKQREVIYKERRLILEGGDLKQKILEMIGETVEGSIDLYLPPTADPEEWNLKSLWEAAQNQFGVQVPPDMAQGQPVNGHPRVDREDVRERLEELVSQAYEARESSFGPGQMRQLEQWVMLQVIDAKWKDHLYAMDHLREGIGYRVYGQQDPLVEYQHEAYQMFQQLVSSIRADVVDLIFKIQAVRPERSARILNPTAYVHPEAPTAVESLPSAPSQVLTEERESPISPSESAHPFHRDQPKVGRNDPCPCGSGTKYKKCHGTT